VKTGSTNHFSATRVTRRLFSRSLPRKICQDQSMNTCSARNWRAPRPTRASAVPHFPPSSLGGGLRMSCCTAPRYIPGPKHPGGLSLPSCCVWCIHLPVLRSYVPQTSRVGRHGRGTRPPDMSARRTAPLQGVRGAVSRVIYVAERMTVPGGDVQVRSGGLTGGAVLGRFWLCPAQWAGEVGTGMLGMESFLHQTSAVCLHMVPLTPEKLSDRFK
jgi:hypothetical protein